MNSKQAIKNVKDVPNKFNNSGGILTGNITFNTDEVIEWSKNTDWAKIGFKNTADNDTDSYMWFEAGDNGNEYFKFRGNVGGTTTDWLTIKSDHLRFKGQNVYHTGNKPSPSDIGAAPSHDHPYIPTSASCNKNWNWTGKGGQPTWLWGGEDSSNMYVYNPLNFNVNHASTADSAGFANEATSCTTATNASYATNAGAINNKKITVSQTAPSSPSTGDLWISW